MKVQTTAIMFALLGLESSTGFSFSGHSSRAPTQSRTTSSKNHHRQPRTLSATIYGGWDDDSDYSSDIFSSDPHQNVVEKLSEKERLASLARIACANSPDDSLTLKNIDKVDVITVDGDHIDFSVLVCDGHECASIFVPVSFTNHCDDDDEECILNNIMELDTRAASFLHDEDVKMQIFSAVDDILMKELHDDSLIQFPEWWHTMITRELMEEIRSTKTLINNDNFQDEVQSLSASLCRMIFDVDKVDVFKARISAINQQGFCMRAIVNMDSRLQVVDLPFKFQKDVQDGSSLRNSILAAFNTI